MNSRRAFHSASVRNVGNVRFVSRSTGGTAARRSGGAGETDGGVTGIMGAPAACTARARAAAIRPKPRRIDMLRCLSMDLNYWAAARVYEFQSKVKRLFA